MKSYVDTALGLYAAICKDAELAIPEIAMSLSRDLSRVRHLTLTKGLPFLSISLPKFGKALDKGLTSGTYTPIFREPGGLRRKGGNLPHLFSGMLLRVFGEDGRLLQDPCLTSVLFLRQLYYCCKKVSVPCKQEYVDNEVDKFCEVDSELYEPPEWWSSSHPSPNPVCSEEQMEDGFRRPFSCCITDTPYGMGNGARNLERRYLHLSQKVADIVVGSFAPFNPYRWPCKHGPGVVSVRPEGNDKYIISNWSDRLGYSFPYEDFAVVNYSHCMESTYLVTAHEHPSRMCAVPKTQEKPRLIAAEPLEALWCQQALWAYMDRSVAKSKFLRHSIHFHDQTHNQERARLASRNGSSWTVDLSAASDRLTPWHVSAFFRSRPELLCAMRDTRTREIVLAPHSARADEVFQLRKYSTMGNATTFPVQSIVFAIIAITATLAADNLPVSRKKIKRACKSLLVFGDDIIVKKKAGPALLDILTLLGFKVNTEKSCTEGMFRESCGMDAFRGYDVTPAYWHCPPDRHRPESVVSSIEASNNFYSKGFLAAAEYLHQEITDKKMRFPLVPMDSGATGLKSRSGVAIPKGKRRWNDDLHHFEYRHDVILSIPQEDERADGYASLLQWLTEQPEASTPWKASVRGKPRTKVVRGWVSHPFLDGLQR